MTWEQLGSPDDAGVVFAHVTYLPGADPAELPQARHRGHEYGFLLSGRLAVEVSGETIELGPGDAISFGSDVPAPLPRGRRRTRASGLVQPRRLR